MSKAFGPRVVLVMGVVLAAVPFRPDSLLAQSRRSNRAWSSCR